MMVQKNDMKEMVQGMRQRFEDERSKMMANVKREAPLSWYTPRMCVAVTQGTAIQGADTTL